MKNIFLTVGCLADGNLLNAIWNDGHAISFHLHSFGSSLSMSYCLSDG
jgi:hypothetical protein